MNSPRSISRSPVAAGGLSRHALAALLLAPLCCVPAARGDERDAVDPPPDPFVIRWTDAEFELDGAAREPQWAKAQTIDRFTLPWLQDKERPARTKTAARLLWTREHLYFFADMEDSDLYADERQQDGPTWLNDVFELFFKPSPDEPGYYEFQVNAAGTKFDMFVPRRGGEMVRRFAKDKPFHVEAVVKRRGTLNKWEDRDKGWSVEGRIPWIDFLPTGGRPEPGDEWRFALCRYDYSVDFEGPELSTSAPLSSRTRPDFHRHEDYAPVKFLGPGEDSAAVAPRGIGPRRPLTGCRVAGSPEPPLPCRAVRTLPRLQVDWPVFVVNEPGSRRLIYIEEEKPYGKTRIKRTVGDPAGGESETLLETSDVAYSICFHPQFAANGWMFVGSNGARDGQPKKSRVTRYTLSRQPPHALVADSRHVVVEWESDGHNGAAVAFGHDGMLYVTTGDGTSDSDTDLAGQRLDHLLAKVLRIDVDRTADGRNYAIPADNPFVNREGVRGETWAYGFRNPWRMSVDPRTGVLWVGQNGQDLWEQVYAVRKGANYGWSVYEGSHPFYPARQLGPDPVSPPTFEHPHSESRSLTGGVVYYGDRLPELRGAYIYGDYSTGKIWAGKLDEQGRVLWHRELADSPMQITSFGLDADGELLITDHHQGGGFHTLVPNMSAGDADTSSFPRKLSETGLFASVPEHRPAAGVLPYSVNSPLWSDGAFKARFLAIPDSAGVDGQAPTIEFHPHKAWGFPDSTVLIKSFGLEAVEGDPSSRRWIETRLMLKEQGEWVGYSYRWNDEQTEAMLVEGEGADAEYSIAQADGRRRQQAWRFPSRTECMVCHSRAAGFVLGLRTPQMNKDHDYGAAVENQLRAWERLGLLRFPWKADAAQQWKQRQQEAGREQQEVEAELARMSATRQKIKAGPSPLLSRDPHNWPRLADPYDEQAPLQRRARSYLASNCAHCHVKAGGGNAQIELDERTELAQMNLLDVKPLHHAFGLPDARIVAPGRPGSSTLLHRLKVRGPGQMPQLATARVDREAVAMLKQWIEQLDRPEELEELEERGDAEKR